MSTTTTEMNSEQLKNKEYYVESSISASEPLKWLNTGLETFKQIPGLSLLYGSLFAALVAITYALTSNIPWFTLSYLTGLVVLGPFIASGLYVARREIDNSQTPEIGKSFRFIMTRKTNLALFTLMLVLIMAAWIRFSTLLFAIKSNIMSPSIEAYTALFSSSDGLLTLTFFAGIGLLLVAVVFLFSAIAIPMILDKDVNFISAMKTSFNAVVSNPKAMLVWAAIIVSFTAFGIATAFIGLAFVFPVLGYATWESYKSLVR